MAPDEAPRLPSNRPIKLEPGQDPPAPGSTALERLAAKYGTGGQGGLPGVSSVYGKPGTPGTSGATPAKPATPTPGARPAPRPAPRPSAATPVHQPTGGRPLHVPGDTVAERVAYRLALKRGQIEPGAPGSSVPPRPAAATSSAAPASAPRTAPAAPRAPLASSSATGATSGSVTSSRPAFALERPRLDTRRPAPADGAPAPAPKRPVAPLNPPTPAEIEASVDHEMYEAYAGLVKSLLGFDLTQYKRPQVWRRSMSFAKQKGCRDVIELMERCRTDLDLRTAVRDMITINVSEFFRNPDAWESLRTAVLPELLRMGRPIRFWSAGCSLGYEPYTFAMMVKEAGGGDAKILATDLDETILAQARASVYADHQMVGVSPARRAKFFDERDATWSVKPELRSMIQWRRQDLLRDPFPSDLDLIACRNVVIYFTDDAKDGLYRRFTQALRVGGTLFIGATEAIGSARSFGLQMVTSGLYRRVE